MNDRETDMTPEAASASAHLGFRIAVGAVGLALLAVFVMLGSVAMKQSATAEALEERESLREDAQSAPARE
jgi:NAD/NADP transhydrogenase alpha subunit